MAAVQYVLVDLLCLLKPSFIFIHFIVFTLLFLEGNPIVVLEAISHPSKKAAFILREPILIPVSFFMYLYKNGCVVETTS